MWLLMPSQSAACHYKAEIAVIKFRQEAARLPDLTGDNDTVFHEALETVEKRVLEARLMFEMAKGFKETKEEDLVEDLVEEVEKKEA